MTVEQVGEEVGDEAVGVDRAAWADNHARYTICKVEALQQPGES